MSSQQPESTKNKKQNLGRGLGSLLSGDSGAFSKMTSSISPFEDRVPAAAPMKKTTEQKTDVKTIAQPQVPSHLRVWQIPIEKISPNPEQPRKTFETGALKELADSIRQKGIIQPLLLQKLPNDKFEIIAGERRWRAAQKAGLKEVPALIKELKDQEILEWALIENIQRKDLNAIEEAEAYQLLMTKFNLTHQDLADRVGKDRVTISNLVRLLQLPPSIRELLLKDEISQGHAKVLLGLVDQKFMTELALKAKAEQLSVRALERLVTLKKTEVSGPPSAVPIKTAAQTQIAPLKEELQKLLGSRVDIDYREGKGKLNLYFYSDDQLNQIIDRLRG